MDINNVKNILLSLISKRLLFHSEDDFKFSLAWEIKSYLPDSTIILEKPYKDKSGSILYFDIMIHMNKSIIPIELKYKTDFLDYKEYNLKKHAALNHSRYDFIKDISRIEKFCSGNDNAKNGFVIFLTNEKAYWDSKYEVKNSEDKYFKIDEQRKEIIKGEHNWNCDCNIKELKKKYGNRTNSIILNNTYPIEWSDYSKLENIDKSNIFKYLLIDI
jgi:hypothetical protein